MTLVHAVQYLVLRKPRSFLVLESIALYYLASRASLVADYLLYSHDLNALFGGNTVTRSKMLISLRPKKIICAVADQ